MAYRNIAENFNRLSNEQGARTLQTTDRRQTDEQCTLPLSVPKGRTKTQIVFTHGKSVADFFSRKFNLQTKNSYFFFLSLPLGLKGNVRCSSQAHWKALSGLRTFFRQVLRLRCHERKSIKNRRFKGGSLWSRISSKRGHPPPNILRGAKLDASIFLVVQECGINFFRFVNIDAFDMMDRRTRTDRHFAHFYTAPAYILRFLQKILQKHFGLFFRTHVFGVLAWYFFFFSLFFVLCTLLRIKVCILYKHANFIVCFNIIGTILLLRKRYRYRRFFTHIETDLT